jgi:uncharacterized protein YegL
MGSREESALQIEISNRQLRSKNAQRTLCVLVVDASISMEANDAIGEVTRGLSVFERDLKADPIAKDRVRVLVVRAGGDVSIARNWTDGSDFSAPNLSAGGDTPLGEAMRLALDQCEDQRAQVQASGNACTLPYIFLLSDGEPNDDGWEDEAEACRRAEAAGKVFVMPFGTGAANLEKLQNFTNKHVFQLKGNSFVEFFAFVARTMRTATRSKPGARLQLELPRTIEIPT